MVEVNEIKKEIAIIKNILENISKRWKNTIEKESKEAEKFRKEIKQYGKFYLNFPQNQIIPNLIDISADRTEMFDNLYKTLIGEKDNAGFLDNVEEWLNEEIQVGDGFSDSKEKEKLLKLKEELEKQKIELEEKGKEENRYYVTKGIQYTYWKFMPKDMQITILKALMNIPWLKSSYKKHLRDIKNRYEVWFPDDILIEYWNTDLKLWERVGIKTSDADIILNKAKEDGILEVNFEEILEKYKDWGGN